MGNLRSQVFLLIAVVAVAGAFILLPTVPVGAKSGPPMVEVIVPKLTALQARGKEAFDANCAECHGARAAGQGGVAPPLIHKIYEPSHHGDLSIVRAAKQGARQHHWPFGDMPPVEGVTDSELAVIIAYIRAVQAANGIE